MKIYIIETALGVQASPVPVCGAGGTVLAEIEVAFGPDFARGLFQATLDAFVAGVQHCATTGHNAEEKP